MLARKMTEREIASQLNVDQSTVSRDITALKETSQRFIFDLAKSDLAYYYKQSLDGIEEAIKEAWSLYQKNESFSALPYKITAALKIIIQANEIKFKLLSEGPSVLNVRLLEEKLSRIENNYPEQ
jgi:IS30 family transposase